MLLIAGASGFLGANALLEAIDAGREATGVFHDTPVACDGARTMAADLAAPGAARDTLDSIRPEWVLNCAALADVDRCERDPDLARRVNVELPRALAASCREAGVRLLHISTDSVFDGRRGNYEENDQPAPINTYSRTKLEGERAVSEELPGALIVRTNFFGVSPGERTGLADWIIRELAVGHRIAGFTDVVFTPLLANWLVRVMFSMMDSGMSGLYHLGGSSRLTKHDFALLLARELELDEKLVKPARLADAELGAARPRDTSLCSSRAEEAIGKPMASVDSSIALLGKLRRSGHAERLNALFGS
jgi:dTDP-4-dehydrorhamnose reductase